MSDAQLPATTPTIPVDLLPRLNSALLNGNGVMAKRYLEAQGLARGANDSIAQLGERFAAYLAEEKLSPGQVQSFVRELREYSAKQVYLLRGDADAMRKRPAAAFDHRVASLDEARVVANPASPVQNYSYVTNDRIRLSFSEVHVSARLLRVGPKQWDSKVTEATKVITIDADLVSGIVSLALDPPGAHHDHGEGAMAYIQHYLDVARTQLGSDLVPLLWYEQLFALTKKEARQLVKLGTQEAQDKQGLDLRMKCGNADLHDYETFQDYSGRISLCYGGKVVWKPTDGEPSRADILAGKALARELRTEVHASPAMVKFEHHTLPHEMTYVLETIRSIA